MIAPLIATLEFSDNGARFTLFLAAIVPAFYFATTQSSYLIDYYIWIVCSNRLVRRILDWSGGAYDQQPISSLLPPAIGVLMTLVIIYELPRFSSRHRMAFYLIAIALAINAVLGLRNGAGMFHSLLEYVTPLSLLFYAIAIRADLRTLDRWISTLSLAVVLVAIYGWNQWVSWPPWDAAWIEWSKMWTSMGHPESFKTSICSTMESRGPYAWFMAMAAIPLLALPQWRRYVGLPGAALVVSAILPSTVRSAWGMIFVGLGIFSLIRGGQGGLRIVMGVLASIAILVAIKSQLPQSEQLFSRVETLSNVSNDSSFQGRTSGAVDGLSMVLREPFGSGLGSSGLSVRVTGAAAKVGDNGLLELISTFGFIGMALLITSFTILVRDIALIHREYDCEHAALALALLTAGVAALAFSNWFITSCSGVAMMTMGAVLSAGYAFEEEIAESDSDLDLNDTEDQREQL